MKRKHWSLVALAASIALSCNSAWSHPEVFSDSTLEQAKAQAKKDGKYLIVDFMATWCPPCKQMESTTWVDEAVKKWIKENAIAIQFDVDKSEKIAQSFNIEAMPTVILFTPQSGDKEFSRQVGLMSASELLQWLEGAKAGKTAKELQQQPEQQEAGNEILQRLGKAHQFLAQEKYEEALPEFLFLWENLPQNDPRMNMVRVAAVVPEMKALAGAYAPAKTRLTELRQAAEKAGNRSDWLLLNEVVGEPEKSLAWFDQAKVDPKLHDEIIKNRAAIEPILFSKGRYADEADVFYPNPLATINEYHQKAEALMKGQDVHGYDPFPNMIILLYASYVGAGRDADVKKISDECIRLDDTPQMREVLTKMAAAVKADKSKASQSEATGASKK